MKNILICLHVILFFINVSTAQFEFLSPENEKLTPDRFQNLGAQIPGISHYFDEAMLDSFILDKMNQQNMPGLAACILNDGQVVWHNNYGYANIAQNKLVTDSTLFCIGSISKTITATAIMQLWEQGLFQLNDSINGYLPQELQVHHPTYPQDPITFEMLLTHTSGINDYWPTLNPLIVQGDSPIPLDSFLTDYLTPGGNYYHQYQNFQHQPGTTFNYCNVGYTLLGYLVECISNTSFPQYCQQNIFSPLNMNHASWFLSGTDTNNVAMPYEMINGQPVATGHLGFPLYPAGLLRINTMEFANFLGTYMQRGIYNSYTLLDSTTIDTMLTRKVYCLWGIYYGLGWYEDWWYGPWLWGHNGHWVGSYAEMLFHPAEKYGFISFANCDGTDNFWVINGEICQFAYLWDKIYPIMSRLLPESNYIRPGIDSLQVTTHFVNRTGDPFNCNAIFISKDSTYVDSVQFYDDGLHGDGGAGDGLWGNYMPPIPLENKITLQISTDNLTTGDYFITEVLDSFSTIGPVVLDSMFVYDGYKVGPFYRVPIEIELRNDGSTTAAQNVRAYLSTSHPRVAGIDNNNQNFGNIPAGQSVLSPDSFIIRLQNAEPIENIVFHIDFLSDNILYWQDSTDIVVGISKIASIVPLEFVLRQNYPNPFNPSTTIEFDLPKTTDVTLKIFNILGEEVATLVSDRLSTGSYTYEWDASNLASGVYLYRLQAGEYIETRKMVLMR